jgi:hypothetical protein
MKGKGAKPGANKVNIADVSLTDEEIKTLPKLNSLVVCVSTNDSELVQFINETTLPTFKMDNIITN